MTRIAIVALGPSSLDYITAAESYGDKSKAFDEVWTVNSYASVLKSDLVFHMDDLKVQEVRAAANPDGKIAAMLGALKNSDVPVMTSRAYADYPAAVAYPLEAVINKLGAMYFTSTPAYALALALYRDAKEISLYGLDYTWPNAHEAEEGRAACEFWIGQGMARGVVYHIAKSSTLMASREAPQHRLYGYDSQEFLGLRADGNVIRVDFKDRSHLPTADEMEARYDHSRPRNLERRP